VTDDVLGDSQVGFQLRGARGVERKLRNYVVSLVESLNWVCQASTPPIVDILYFATSAYDKIVDPIHGSRQFFVAKLRAQDRYELILMQAFLLVRAAASGHTKPPSGPD